LTASKVALLIEDDADQRALYSLILRRRGWKTLEAATGEQAQALLQSVYPDAIVLDVMLPDRDGIKLCHDLRANPNLPIIPILVLTALNDPDTRIRALAAGADAFEVKPIKPATLVDHLDQLTTF